MYNTAKKERTWIKLMMICIDTERGYKSQIYSNLFRGVTNRANSVGVRMATNSATKGDWHTKPMPEKSTVIEVNKEYSSEEMERIRVGYVPQEMEEKWFIYFDSDESDSRLYLHRSWTGICIYIVRFEERGEGKFVATTAEVNRDPSEYTSTDDEHDKELLLELIASHFYIV